MFITEGLRTVHTSFYNKQCPNYLFANCLLSVITCTLLTVERCMLLYVALGTLEGTHE